MATAQLPLVVTITHRITDVIAPNRLDGIHVFFQVWELEQIVVDRSAEQQDVLSFVLPVEAIRLARSNSILLGDWLRCVRWTEQESEEKEWGQTL